MSVALRNSVVVRYKEAAWGRRQAKKPTFQEARSTVFEFLKKRGWKLAENLTVPHATSPDGKVRLWFKSQAVYAVNKKRVEDGANPLQIKDSHSMSSDLREDVDESRFMSLVERWTGYKD